MTTKNPFNLEGKVALVTGASGAIGRDICLALARAGADVIVSGRNSERLKKTAKMIADCGRQSSIIAADLADLSDVQKLAENSLAGFDHVDILVNNAATNVFKKAERFTQNDFDMIMNTNIKGGFFLSQRLAEHMQAGSMTRNLPWLVETHPSMFVEMSPELAAIIGVSAGDDVIVKGFEFLTKIPMSKVKSIASKIKAGANPMKFKKDLAFEIVQMLQSKTEAEKAQKNFEKVFQSRGKPEKR